MRHTYYLPSLGSGDTNVTKTYKTYFCILSGQSQKDSAYSDK